MIARAVEIMLVRRGVSCVADLLEDEAPLTSAAVWSGLHSPRETPAWHARMAGCEVYSPGASFVELEPPLENATVLPLPGDVLYFHRRLEAEDNSEARFSQSDLPAGSANVAIWYGPANGGNLLRVETGLRAGTRFARIRPRDLAKWAAACETILYDGNSEERIRLSRYDSVSQ